MDPPSPWTAGIRKQILVRVATDEGLVGWGEAFALGAPTAVCAVIADALRPLLLGRSPLEIERLTDQVHRATVLYGPGLAATLHFAAATPGVQWVELPGGELTLPLLETPLEAADGWVTVPTGPGLGVRPSEAALRRYPLGPEPAAPFATGR